MARARYLLNSFVLGRELEEAQDLKRLYPLEKEVWEFRTTLVPPSWQLRLFGWFPAPNHFVLVHCKRRQDLEASTGPKWNKAIQRVVDTRNSLFAGVVLYQGVSYGDYIN